MFCKKVYNLAKANRAKGVAVHTTVGVYIQRFRMNR